MRIRKIEIWNIKGVEHAVFAPKTINTIRGANGSGKSSIIDAIRAIFNGGSDPNWLRRGCSEGSIALELDNDTTITKTVKRNKRGDIKCELEILDRQGVPIPAPQTFVNRLSESVDPARILGMDATTEKGRRELVTLLLGLMPVEFSVPETQDACTVGPESETLHVPERGLDLDGLAKLKALLTEARRRIGIQRDDASGAVQQIRKTFVEVDPKDWRAVASALQLKLDSARAELSKVQQFAKDSARKQELEIGADIEARMEALRQERDSRLAKVRSTLEAGLKRVNEVAAGDIGVLTAELGDARARADTQIKATAAKQMEKDFLAKDKELTRKYDRHTDALNNIDFLRKKKLDSLSVPGLEFDGDRVLVDGTPWEHVNKARLSEIALQLTALGSGELMFLVADDVEHLDSESRKALHEAITAGGYQFVEALVDPDAGPLRIESRDEVTA